MRRLKRPIIEFKSKQLCSTRELFDQVIKRRFNTKKNFKRVLIEQQQKNVYNIVDKIYWHSPNLKTFMISTLQIRFRLSYDFFLIFNITSFNLLQISSLVILLYAISYECFLM